MSSSEALRILLPVDGSEAALAAVRHVVALHAGGLALDVLLVNVQAPPTLYEVVTVHDRERLDALRAEAGADLLAPARALLDAAGVPVRHDVLGGDAAGALVDALDTHGIGLVVIGASGQGGSTHALGSTASSVLAHATVPVTVVRAPEPASDPDVEAEPDAGGPIS